MHDEAKKLVEKRIDLILKEFDFDNRKKNFDECVCYKSGKKCHKIERLNCFLCYCPNYDLSKKEGGCLISNEKGKWHIFSSGRIWDCSDCDWPHLEENVRMVLMKIWG